jgi:hypothetical protein
MCSGLPRAPDASQARLVPIRDFHHGLLGALAEMQIYLDAGETRSISLDANPELAPSFLRSLSAAGRQLRRRIEQLEIAGINGVPRAERLFSSESQAWFHAANRLADCPVLLGMQWRSEWQTVTEQLRRRTDTELRLRQYRESAADLRRLDAYTALLQRFPDVSSSANPSEPAAFEVAATAMPQTQPSEDFKRVEDLNCTARLAFGLAHPIAPAEADSSDLGFKDWRIPERDLANAAFFDNTTLVTTNELLFAEQPGLLLTPLTVFDLATFVTSAVLQDRIFHLANDKFNTDAFNRMLGEPVFVTVSTSDNRNALERIWHEAFQYLFEMRRQRPSDGDGGKEMKWLLDAWTIVLGRSLRVDDLVAPDENTWWASQGKALLLQLVAAIDPPSQLFGFFPNEFLNIGTSEFLRRVVSECNHRSYFNERVAISMSLPYAANAARLPVQYHRQCESLNRHEMLSSIGVIEEHYRLAMGAYGSRTTRVPFFLATVLARASRLDEFFSELRELRASAHAFRQMRVALDQAVSNGDRHTISDIRNALDAHAGNWATAIAGPVIGAIAAIVAACASGPPAVLFAAALAMTSGMRGLSETDRSTLVRRILRPQFSFLTKASEQAQSILDARKHIDRLWGSDVRRDRLLGDRLTAIASLTDSR